MEKRFTQPAGKSNSSVNKSEKTEPRAEPGFPVVLLIAPPDNHLAVGRLLHHLSPSLGMAFIVVKQPSYGPITEGQADESSLPGLLADKTKMKVNTVKGGVQLEKDQVYILPGQVNVNLVNGKLDITPRFTQRKEDDIVDLLLADLAYACGRQAIVILFPGLTIDIMAGLRVIKAEGGFVFMQKELPFLPETAHSAEMAGYVDLILPRAGISDRLAGLKSYFSDPGVNFNDPGVMDPHPERQTAWLERIYPLLLDRHGFDLSRYSPADVLCRIRRRMAVYGTEDLEIYGSFLEENAGEITQLYLDLLTGLPGIFFDAECGRMLVKEVLPRLMSMRSKTQPLRVWIPQCSGEEACSVAITIKEYLSENRIDLPVQVFATDLNRAAIEKARCGFYEEAALAGVGPRRLREYFTKQEKGYLVTASIRKVCIFATHNLLKDPPFSRVDIVVGRNILTGLDSEHLNRVYRALHYSLNPRGYLLLDGETWCPPDLFVSSGEAPGLYNRKDAPAAFALPAVLRQNPDGEQEAATLLLNAVAPAAVLVDDMFRVVRFYGDSSPYLRTSSTRPSLHILQLLSDSIIFDINLLFERAAREKQAVRADGIWLSENGGMREIGAEIIPLRSMNWRLLIFRERGAAGGNETAAEPDDKDRKIIALEKKYREARRQLMIADERAAKTREDLQAAQEELMSSNEELQSLNEALETAKQELEAYNHELNVVNTDLHTRNKVLETSVEYAHAIVAAIRQPLVILQNDLRIRTANSAFYSFFNLVPGDVQGEYLYTAGKGILDLDDLRQRLQDMLTKRTASLDFEVHHTFPGIGERILALNASRMQEQNGRRPGILLAMTDITDRKMAERFKDEFIGIASHELKTPATSIQAYTQILYNDFVEANDQRSAQLVSRLNSQVTRLAHLAKDLLDITRITQGQISLKKDYFDINVLIREIVEEMQLTTQVRLSIRELAAAVPAIFGDRDRIGQVVVNLLSNAIKYSAGAETIELATVLSGEVLHLTIHDFGIGMSPETMQKIFDRFYRADDPASMRHPGLGLGLYIASEIVRRHGGTIRVTSEKGKGSIFTVILPLFSSL
jgi:two-component system CheB/CheR fusion protein